jgi:ATP-binding cassette subfamily F protein 3
VRKQVRGILGSFLFSGDSIDKKVKVLSGGERTRLALCRLLLKPHNLLILDEPTNHLDLRSKDVLKQALSNFDGTLIVVSHDRDFLSGLTNKTFEFKDKRVKQYIGDVNEFLIAKKAEDFRAIEQAASSNSNNSNQEKKQESGDTRDKEARTLKSQLNTVEKKIAELEKKIADFDAILNDANRYQELVNDRKKFDEYESMKKELESKMEEWERIQLEIDKLK